MHRLARWVLKVLTMLSLLLCVVTCVLWVRSAWWRSDVVWHDTANHEEGFMSVRGRVAVWWGNPWYPPGRAPSGLGARSPRASAADQQWLESFPIFFDRGRLGFDVVRHDLSWSYVDREWAADMQWTSFARGTLLGAATIPPGAVRRRVWLIILPDWGVMMLAVLLPAYRWRTWRRARRARGIPSCASCSYDLTGNVSGVCPECGTKMAAGAQPAEPAGGLAREDD